MSWAHFFPVIIAGLASQALATTFVEQPFPDTVKDAPVIVRGTTGMSYSDWSRTPGGQRNIYTYTELQVEEVLKGSVSEPRVYMRELGGEKDGVGMRVSGTAEFRRGEDVVVFLGDTVHEDGSRDLHGMMMGKYNIARNENGEEVLSGAGLGIGADPATRAHQHFGRQKPDGHVDTDSGKTWTLSLLRDLIREQAGQSDSVAPSPNSASKPAVAPTHAADATPAKAGSLTAPQLHPSSSEGASSFTFLGNWLFRAAIAIAGVLVILLILRRK